MLALREHELRAQALSNAGAFRDRADCEEAPQAACRACSPEMQELLHVLLEDSGLLGCTSQDQLDVILDVMDWDQYSPTFGPACRLQARLIHKASLALL
jgi:hypothetical protein